MPKWDCVFANLQRKFGHSAKSTHRNMMICGPLKTGNKIYPQVTQNLIKSVVRNTRCLSPHSKYWFVSFICCVLLIVVNSAPSPPTPTPYLFALVGRSKIVSETVGLVDIVSRLYFGFWNCLNHVLKIYTHACTHTSIHDCVIHIIYSQDS